MDWARFSFDWTLRRERLSESLIEIEAHRRATSLLNLPVDWREQLDRLNRVRAVHGTTALEGNPLSEREVRQQMELLKEDPASDTAARPAEHREVRNASRAQDWVKERFSPESSRPLDRGDLLRMHALLTEGSDEERTGPGRLRTVSVTAGSEELGGVHRCAPPERVARLVDEFVEFVNSSRLRREHPTIRALLAHFFLVTIHPFGDGNGRTSRLVEMGILFQGGYNLHGFYGLSNHFYQHGDQYKRLLQRSRRTQPFDLQEFVEFGLAGFAAELNGINDFIQTKTNRVFYRDALHRARALRVGERRRALSQREYDLLDFLLKSTDPVDPFANDSARRFSLSDLLREPTIRALYGTVTDRTLRRELLRLAENRFLRFEQQDRDWFVELDFEAITRY